MSKPFNRIAILGLGLIGSSLARALMKQDPTTHIAAFDKSHSACEFAAKEGFVHSHYPYPGDAVENAELVIFATPPGSFSKLAREIASVIKGGAIITDVASIKRAAIAAIAPEVPAYAFFVPGHPIAGSEKSGVQAGRADLFTGKRVILTPEERDVLSEPVARVRGLWESIGAKPECMPAALHDRIYAYVSHLPQLVAYAAAECLRDAPENSALTGLSRLAKSKKTLWADICLLNADCISEALADFTAFAGQMMGELSRGENSGKAEGDPAALFSQVIGSCLIATASLLEERTGVHPGRFAGSGFADMTAPAKGDPNAVLAAISAHHRQIAGMLEVTLTRLHSISDSLKREDRSELMKEMG